MSIISIQDLWEEYREINALILECWEIKAELFYSRKIIPCLKQETQCFIHKQKYFKQC